MNISEVCRKYDISQHTLRYYERIGLLPRVPRTAGRVRDYSERDCDYIKFVKCMRAAGFQIGPLKDYLKLVDGGPETIPARKRLLESQRDRIRDQVEEMTAVLSTLSSKIENYDRHLLTAEQRLSAGPEAP
ncbi:MAG: MerR family transcriptional regulator [Deltaproteobacteria bacterium]|jgi:DNA-binding transcriptional MerR regulator|nr:MerR family transcriptional regulator [Deltaproteobacteria bacterium]